MTRSVTPSKQSSRTPSEAATAEHKKAKKDGPLPKHPSVDVGTIDKSGIEKERAQRAEGPASPDR